MFRLLLMAIAMLFLFSCSEDQDLVTSLNQENQFISQRSQSPAGCDNLLINGDFSNFTEPPLCDEVDAFGEGRVANWFNAFGTPDLYSPAGWEHCNLCETPQLHAARLFSGSDSYEGIAQNVTITSDPDIY